MMRRSHALGSATTGCCLLDVIVRQVARRTRQPAVDDRLPQGSLGDRLQLDQNSRVPVEMRNREEGLGLRGEHGLLLAEVFNSNREDRSIWRAGIAEPPDVCLAEWPFPREGLAANG